MSLILQRHNAKTAIFMSRAQARNLKIAVFVPIGLPVKYELAHNTFTVYFTGVRRS